MNIRICKIELDPQPGSLVAARLVVAVGNIIIREVALVATLDGLKAKMPLAPNRAAKHRIPAVEIACPGTKAAINDAALAAFYALGGDGSGAMAALAARDARDAALRDGRVTEAARD